MEIIDNKYNKYYGNKCKQTNGGVFKMVDNNDKNIYTVYTKYEWDEQKNKSNIAKHGVSFEEAVTVFDDPRSLMFMDWNHSAEEDRFIIIGVSDHANILIVCHCYRDNDSIIRIISARKAEKDEETIYAKRYFDD